MVIYLQFSLCLKFGLIFLNYPIINVILCNPLIILLPIACPSHQIFHHSPSTPFTLSVVQNFLNFISVLLGNYWWRVRWLSERKQIDVIFCERLKESRMKHAMDAIICWKIELVIRCFPADLQYLKWTQISWVKLCRAPFLL